MTNKDSLDAIAGLLTRLPGVSSAAGFTHDDGMVSIFFRCRDFESLKSIERCAVASNVSIRLRNPDTRSCYEAPDVVDCPFGICIEDDQGQDGPPTTTQIFGIFLARFLKRAGLLDVETSDRLQAEWNAVVM